MPEHTVNFTHTGDWQKWNVPDGVKTIDLVVKGASAQGVAGGRVTGKMRVNPKQTLFLMVGRKGFDNVGVTGGDPSFGGGGRGGNAGPGSSGGGGGGGATAIRVNAKDGPIRVVAGGAGGTSGGGGAGGRGGSSVGEFGSPEAVAGTHSNATGGTQSQPGRGGTSGAGTAYWGKDGNAGKLARGGAGAGPNNAGVKGGGGGGGGFYAGGGGQAGAVGTHPAGGGAGGSNFTGGLYQAVSDQGNGGATDHGSISITWLDPEDLPPVPPEDITINGVPISNGLATQATNSVTLRGTPDHPDQEEGVRLLVWVSTSSAMTNHTKFKGTYDPVDHRDVVQITGLEKNTRYWLRIYTQDQHGLVSQNFRSTNFWTNRPPNPPTLMAPADNAQFTVLDNILFQWNHTDPDGSGDDQTAFRLRFRRAMTPLVAAGEWTQIEQVTSFEQWTVDAGTFKGQTFYEWTVKTRDEANHWGEWAEVRSFFVTDDSSPPVLYAPTNFEAIIASEDNLFRWQFVNPAQNAVQTKADLRYRAYSAVDWTVLTGDTTTPGAAQEWLIPADTFAEYNAYEWQVQTYGTIGSTSDWSESSWFWTVAAPGSGAGLEVIESGHPAPPLGRGENRVYIYDRGGNVLRGEISPVADLRWHRVRDDISTANVRITAWDDDTKGFLSTLHSWLHEVVIIRDGVRVWEGPISRITNTRDVFEIEAWDCWAYVYRRIMRQGYNDAYRLQNGTQVGLRTIVQRAQQIVMNSLAYDDPNVIPYLTPYHHHDDALQSRVVPDYAKTAWQEIDDLAQNAGLDYTASGRRLIIWDTHRAIGKLPEMRDGDFSDPPVISEYGMTAANYFAVTSGDGVWGAASRGLDEDGQPGPQGWIEQLASAYGETPGTNAEQSLTKEAKKRLQEALRQQAERNIAGRWPPPKIVRVPDNSTLSPEVPLGINQLIPGVWVPLRIVGGVHEVSQWQKLDSITVTQNAAEGERVNVVMSPAPNGGQDPDASVVAEGEG